MSGRSLRPDPEGLAPHPQSPPSPPRPFPPPPPHGPQTGPFLITFAWGGGLLPSSKFWLGTGSDFSKGLVMGGVSQQPEAFPSRRRFSRRRRDPSIPLWVCYPRGSVRNAPPPRQRSLREPAQVSQLIPHGIPTPARRARALPSVGGAPAPRSPGWCRYHVRPTDKIA